MKSEQWLPGKDVEGILRLPPMTEDAKIRRGITFDVPERFVVKTPHGQVDAFPGDFVLTYPSGNRYVMRPGDWAWHQPLIPVSRFKHPYLVMLLILVGILVIVWSGVQLLNLAFG